MSDGSAWYVAVDGKPVGPFTLEVLVEEVKARGGVGAMVYGPGLNTWTRAGEVPQVAGRLGGAGGFSPPPIPPGGAGYGAGGRRAHELSYEIFGSEMQYVEVKLDPGETAIAEPGSLMFMTAGVKMETVFGDPNQQQGFLGKVMTAGKRMLTGESLFMSTFTNQGGRGEETVAFAAPYPGKILPLELQNLGGEIICQKDSFIAAAKGIDISIAFQKKVGVALFGGEGFIMQRLRGDGLCLVHAGGTLMERTLGVGETLRIDTGCLVAMEPRVNFDIQFIGGIKNTLFGGEGLFFATLQGPGKVWLQSLPFSRLAGRVLANATGMRGGKDEGSLLGGLGLGTLLSQDE